MRIYLPAIYMHCSLHKNGTGMNNINRYFDVGKSVFPPTSNLQPTTYNLQPTTYNLQPSRNSPFQHHHISNNNGSNGFENGRNAERNAKVMAALDGKRFFHTGLPIEGDLFFGR